MNKTVAPLHGTPPPIQYSEQRPLTPEAVQRLARVFLLLASVKLPDEQANEEADHRTNTEPS